ncbi:MAG: diaminopropionate ammonia-lyase [Microbacterium sp.]
MSHVIENPAADLRSLGVAHDPQAVLAYHRTLPEYRRTPLVRADALAARLGVRTVWVKNEASRLGLPAFKILGASWATARAISTRLGVDLAGLTLDGLTDAVQRDDRLKRLVAATDGNHGRAVARMAKLLGLESLIFVPEGTVASRIEAIESEGATVIVHPDNYDSAVRKAAEEESDDTMVIADTAWEGYTDIPRWVVDGYSTITQEVREELSAAGEPLPDVIAVQMGVGAFAASVVENFADLAPRVIGVEPEKVACIAQSIEAGHIVPIEGQLDSIMAGLNCGEPSPIAWPALQKGLAEVVLVSDADAEEAMRALAAEGVVAGESGAAGLAGLLVAADSLGPDDVVLVVNTEGATDPLTYERIIGAAPAAG